MRSPHNRLARGHSRARAALVILALAVAATAFPTGSAAEQASQPGSPAAGQLDVSGGTEPDPAGHSCAIGATGEVRCWGFGGAGRLGYGNTVTIGDDETPGSVGPVDVGAARTATAISAGAFHTCTRLDDGSVRCWGFGGDGRLGYGNTVTIGDDERPGSADPIELGGAATAITAGGGHSCAVLDGGSVRCWGFGSDGRLGYGNRNNVGDNEPPASAGPVDLGPDRKATAVSAGRDHTCALLDDGNVRCWGYGFLGRLGYGNQETIGEDEHPGSVGPVSFGGAGATAISAGGAHSCALLDGGSVRCWGYGGNGRLGYAGTTDITDPAAVGPVDLGPDRTALAISAGDAHTCALLDNGSVRCWGYGANGRLGYAGTSDVGDDEPPGSVGPVNLGTDRTAVAISAGARHTCARLDDASVRCWGAGFTGRLGYCNERDVGDDETPGTVGQVNLATAVYCPVVAPAPGPAAPPTAPAPPARTPSTPPAPSASARPFTAKLALARARILRRERVLDVFAPITSLASGWARVELHAGGLIYSFSAQINAGDARIRFRKRIPKKQAALATGILTIAYRGDADTRPQTVRLRAASQRADLRLSRPSISNGRLRASGTISRRARGVVRVQIEYVVAGKTHTREFKAPIRSGRWSLNERLSRTVRTAIVQRTGTVHSYALFTGYMARRIRGEMRSFQVLGAG